MSFRDQKKYIETLLKYEKKMDSKEAQFFKMLVKRHKDDEDLDKLSLQKLYELFEKYHANREKKTFDHIFKKPGS